MSDRHAGYETDRPDVQAHVPVAARSILDAARAQTAAQRLDRVIVGDAEAFIAAPPPPEAPFDCLIAADVLEHLVDPWTTLTRAVALVRPGGTVVVSVPNVLFFGGLLRVVRERRWPRDPEGVFDRTHLRWFSRSDAEELVRGAGLHGIQVEPRYFVEGRALRRRRQLARTPLAPFLPVQHIVTGIR
jgi:SAM-dependent methyltransferase